MPELPEVETVVRDLRPKIVGAEIQSIPILLAANPPDPSGRGPRGGPARPPDRVGRAPGEAPRDRAVGRAGPHDPPEDDRPAVRRAGRAARGSAPPPRPGLQPMAASSASGTSASSAGSACTSGTRPRASWSASRAATAVFAAFGPEPLDPSFGPAQFRRRLRARKGRLKPLLLDQSFIAGIGNIYADEALWTARLHPLRSAASLRPADERRLYLAIRSILAEAVERRGSSIDDYTAPDGDGEMQERLNVYQRSGQACPRCGRPIRRIVVGGRATHFCSWCQHLPGADRRAIERSAAGRAMLRGLAAQARAGGRSLPPRPGRFGRRPPRRPAGPGPARAPADVDPALREGQPGDRGLRDPRRDRRVASPWATGSAWSARTEPARRLSCGSPPASTSRTSERSAGSAGCRSACSPRKPTSTPRSWPRPDLRTAVRTAAADLLELGQRLRELEVAHEVEGPAYADLQHQFEILGGYTLDQRIDETLSGLGFSRDEWTKPPANLSGGEQTRAALARLVIADPDLMLLDEPTNHLDLAALEWLEEHLRRRSGSLLVASHDRAFLDGTVGRVWELRDRRLTAFRGDYAAYHRQRLERDARLDKDVSTQAEQIAREQELIQRYRSHRKFAKMHEHEARLERLQAARLEAPRPGRKLRLPTAALVGAGPTRSGEIVARAENLVVGYLPRFRREAGDSAASVDASRRGRAGRIGGTGSEPGAPGDRPGPVPGGPAGRPDRDRRPEWGGQDDPPAHDRRRPSAARRRADDRDGRLDWLPGPAPGGGDRRRDGPRRAAGRDPDHRGRSSRLPRPVPVPGRRCLQGSPDPVRGRAVAARAGPARDHAREPAPARRADEPPRHPRPRGDRGVHDRKSGNAPRGFPRPAPARDGV